MNVTNRLLHLCAGRSRALLLPAEVHFGLLPKRAAATTERGSPLSLPPYLVSVYLAWEWFPRLIRIDGEVRGVCWVTYFGLAAFGRVLINSRTSVLWFNCAMRRTAS